MKQFYTGLKVLIGAIIISAVYHPFGLIATVVSIVYKTITWKDPLAIVFKTLKWVNGMFAALGYLMEHLAIALDMTWNVNGKLIETCITDLKETHFEEPGITVSASTGVCEYTGHINKTGLWFSRRLNKVFNQIHHAVGAWLYYEQKIRLEEEYFESSK